MRFLNISIFEESERIRLTEWYLFHRYTVRCYRFGDTH